MRSFRCPLEQTNTKGWATFKSAEIGSGPVKCCNFSCMYIYEIHRLMNFNFRAIFKRRLFPHLLVCT